MCWKIPRPKLEKQSQAEAKQNFEPCDPLRCYRLIFRTVWSTWVLQTNISNRVIHFGAVVKNFEPCGPLRSCHKIFRAVILIFWILKMKILIRILRCFLRDSAYIAMIKYWFRYVFYDVFLTSRIIRTCKKAIIICFFSVFSLCPRLLGYVKMVISFVFLRCFLNIANS